MFNGASVVGSALKPIEHSRASTRHSAVIWSLAEALDVRFHGRACCHLPQQREPVERTVKLEQTEGVDACPCRVTDCVCRGRGRRLNHLRTAQRGCGGSSARPGPRRRARTAWSARSYGHALRGHSRFSSVAMATSLRCPDGSTAPAAVGGEPPRI